MSMLNHMADPQRELCENHKSEMKFFSQDHKFMISVQIISDDKGQAIE